MGVDRMRIDVIHMDRLLKKLKILDAGWWFHASGSSSEIAYLIRQIRDGASNV
jgi:hypothetical protein